MKLFQQSQLDFTQHLRDPEHYPMPNGVEDKRVAVYRDLVYNNIVGFIAGAFPMVRQVLEEDIWHLMVRSFIAKHKSQTPYFLEISQEFLHYLEREFEQREEYPPFLLELAHYEWVELALDVAEEELPPVTGAEFSLLDGFPQVSPLAWPLVYQFPVHKIGPGFQPSQAAESPVFLIAYRNRDDQVKFMEVNALTYSLLQGLQENNQARGREALLAIAQQINHPDPMQLLHDGELLLQQLFAAEIITGVDVTRD